MLVLALNYVSWRIYNFGIISDVAQVFLEDPDNLWYRFSLRIHLSDYEAFNADGVHVQVTSRT